ncbi:MAG: aminotransferase class V-fold PLP-dependent enzyme [Deferribacteres bacterium]|nr:aminotransferase class V-fold PLP-dependent enzyme [candidate division KSB1 bacterium]MCB9500476.1 aminotransferase class V-fold PLP-dependent enzyme [Deferribacteres bacterium]
MPALENYFAKFRKNIIGTDFCHSFPSGDKPIIYADWAASGRLYRPIEDFITDKLGPYVANTHTETTLTGTVMTDAYHQAHHIIKKHVNANGNDVLLFAGFGMTTVVNKFQRILGLRVPEKYKDCIPQQAKKRPLVILTHMEHHSNQTTWEESLCDVRIINRKNDGLPDLDHLRQILEESKERELLIGSFSGCSNVTGIITPYHEMAAIMHEYGGYCFVDFSASAAYLDIDMHPADESQRLDAIFFSPHKFLGGPGSSGVIIFHKELYKNKVPDHPGGGTVLWTNPWGGHRYHEEIELREDGGTPGFLQAIKAALSILLKEEMGVESIVAREHELTNLLMTNMRKNPFIQILEDKQENRLGYISFYSKNLHYNLLVKLLNDKFGIQTRGGCSCAGTYGHILLEVDLERSKTITDKIDHGDLTDKPGWVRISIHPTMTDAEILYIVDGINQTLENYNHWQNEYDFERKTAEFQQKTGKKFMINLQEGFIAH